MITNKYKYPELKRIENTLGRFYIDPENNEVPSVTTVLDNMSAKCVNSAGYFYWISDPQECGCCTSGQDYADNMTSNANS